MSISKHYYSCNNSRGIYTCPKCSVLYCSMTCYQSEDHVQCSEKFYRDCVMEGISTAERDPEAKKKMLDILQRTYEDSAELSDTLDLDSDDDEYVDLSIRLKDVDLDNADEVWQKLNTDEQQEFEAFVRWVFSNTTLNCGSSTNTSVH